MNAKLVLQNFETPSAVCSYDGCIEHVLQTLAICLDF